MQILCGAVRLLLLADKFTQAGEAFAFLDETTKYFLIFTRLKEKLPKLLCNGFDVD